MGNVMALTMRDVDEFRKICFLGLATVGKSTLSDRLAKPEFKFNPSRRETNGLDFNIIKVTADAKVHALQIWDIAGTELRTDNNLLKDYLKDTSQVVVCFDSTADNMLTQVHYAISVIESVFENMPPITIIGCKFDDPEQKDDWTRIVTSVQEQFFPGKSIPLHLCSAKNKTIYEVNSNNSLRDTDFNEFCVSLAKTSLKPASTSSTLRLPQNGSHCASPSHLGATDTSGNGRNIGSRAHRLATADYSGNIQSSSSFFGKLFCCLRGNSNDQARENAHLLEGNAPPSSPTGHR